MILNPFERRHEPTLFSTPRARSALRPPPRPFRVLDPRRSLPDPGPREARRRARDAGRVAHRPRLARRRGRPLQGGARRRSQAGDRLRGLRRRRPPRAAEGLRAPHAARRDERGLREPDQALLARLPRGLLLQAARRLGAAREPRRGTDRALRLPLRPRLQGARGEPRRPTPRPSSTGSSRSSAASSVYVELQNAHLDVQQRINPELVELADEARPAGRRHGGRPLPAPRGRAVARGAPLHPVRRLAQEPEPLALRDRPVLLQDARGDGRRLPRPRGRAAPDARGRRALQRGDRAGPDPAPALPDTRRPGRLRVPRRALREGRREALRDGRRRSSASASSSS